ncbi:DoxX family protein [Streptomyces oryzae]|uniref:DoxX family protein n=1 Tax=Streptomyces oryzae TaxID=1434886 RepID=A0ABS3X9V3_9ACTN|nr:DoxX family protein [Streptomyces oryzae]MBO8192162.1 DoxX family protein [Streptomyces oryzae]
MSEAHSALSIATAGEGAVPGRRHEIAVKVLTVLLALFLGAASGLPKLFRAEAAVEAFDKIGWGDWFMYAVGSLEVLGALALLVPILSGAAALAFIGLMIGATVFNLTVLDAPQAVLTTAILTVVLGYIAWSRRTHTTQLLRRLRP